MTSIPSLNQMGWKLTNLGHFEIFTKNRDLAGRAGRSKNGRSHFKLILWCFWVIISPHTKFHPNRMKNIEVENFPYWSVLVGRAGRSKNGCSHFKNSDSQQRLTNDLCTKFQPNRMKFDQVSPSWNFFPKIEIWLVGPVCMDEIGSRIRIQST